MAYENVNATPNFQRQVLGQKGFRYLTGAASGTAGEHYRAITALADASVTVVSESGDNLTTVTLSAGITIYGLFSEVSIASGTIVAYIA